MTIGSRQQEIHKCCQKIQQIKQVTAKKENYLSNLPRHLFAAKIIKLHYRCAEILNHAFIASFQ